MEQPWSDALDMSTEGSTYPTVHYSLVSEKEGRI